MPLHLFFASHPHVVCSKGRLPDLIVAPYPFLCGQHSSSTSFPIYSLCSAFLAEKPGRRATFSAFPTYHLGHPYGWSPPLGLKTPFSYGCGGEEPRALCGIARPRDVCENHSLSSGGRSPCLSISQEGYLSVPLIKYCVVLCPSEQPLP